MNCASAIGAVIALPVVVGSAATAFAQYSITNLGRPAGASSAIGVRMNNLGHVAGWSQYFGQGEPSLKGWVWTPSTGFTILPPPPGFPNGRSRAMDISDGGIVAGDGGFDSGLAWRYENGAYTVTGGAEGMPIAYLGGLNNNGDIIGTARDDSITTPDYAFLDVNGSEMITLTPSGGRGTDINNMGVACGYTASSFAPFEAYRWSPSTGLQPMGALGLAHSFAARINDAGHVVGHATSGNGNTKRAWIYTDEAGMQPIPGVSTNASIAVSINNNDHVAGYTELSGPDFNWLWTGGATVTPISTLINTAAANVNLLNVRDINDAGQILIEVFDNNAAETRMLVLTPPGGAPVPGDVDGDGDVDLIDAATLVEVLIGHDSDPAHVAGADVNDDGALNGLDVIALVSLMLEP